MLSFFFFPPHPSSKNLKVGVTASLTWFFKGIGKRFPSKRMRVLAVLDTQHQAFAEKKHEAFHHWQLLKCTHYKHVYTRKAYLFFGFKSRGQF